jgi:hypothetical protein
VGKVVDLAKYIQENRLRLARLRTFPEKRVRGNRRPRKPEDVLLFQHMIRNQREVWIRAGILEIVGPMRFRFRLPKT